MCDQYQAKVSKMTFRERASRLLCWQKGLPFAGLILQKTLNNWQYELEAQGPCTGHRSSIAILYCFSFKYMKREKGRDQTQYTIYVD